MADGSARARSLVGILALLALAWLAAEAWAVRRAGQGLDTAAAAHGIVSWELAGSTAEASQILESWRPEGGGEALPAWAWPVPRASLAADRGLVVAYGAAIALVALWGAWATGLWRWLATLVIAMPLVAALADVRENAYLAAQLDLLEGARCGAADCRAMTVGAYLASSPSEARAFGLAVAGARVAAQTKFVLLLLGIFGAVAMAGGALRARRRPVPAAADPAGRAAATTRPAAGRFKALVDLETEGLFAHDPWRTADDPDVSVHEAADEPRVRFRAADVIGLALSGGGIRSATFNLGWLQGLHRLDLLPRIDYVATVSGGGYVGSFWSEWLRRKARPASPPAGGGDVARTRLVVDPPDMFPTRRDCGAGPQDRTDSHQERHLREFSGFLAPRVGLFELETWTAVVAVVSGLVPALALCLAALGLGVLGWLLLATPVAAREGDAPIATIASITLVVLLVFEQMWRSVKSESAGTARGAAGETAGVTGWLPTLAFTALALMLVIGSQAMVMARASASPHRVWLAVAAPAPSEGGAATAGGRGYVTGWCDVTTGRGMPDCRPSPRGTWWGVMGVTAPRGAWVFSPRLFDFSLAWLATALILVVARLAYPLTSGLPVFLRNPRRRWLSAYDRALMRVLGLAVVWAGMAALWHVAMNLSAVWSALVTAAVSAGVFAALRNWIGLALQRPQQGGWLDRLKPFVPQLLAYVTVVLTTAAMGRLLIEWGGSDWFRWWTGAAGMSGCLLAGLFIDPHRFGLHAFYRERICRAYAGASNLGEGQHAGFNRGTDARETDDRPIAQLVERPLHLVCCAANDLSGDSLETLGRGARSAVVSRHGFSIGDAWCAPEDDLTLGAVVTASAAAFNSNMGRISQKVGPVVSFLMTALNLRLGLWLRHPLAPAAGSRRWPGLLLYREMLGMTSASGAPLDDRTPPLLMRDVHLSDGGHFENLALYELVRRHCRYVIVSDCGADPDVAFDDLGNAIRRVREDFGVDITLDVTPLRPRGDGTSAQHVAVGTIEYSSTDRGILLYVKPSITGDEPPDVLQYRTRNPTFPHEATTDQFYDEAQWESYRRLGLHAAQRVFEFLPPAVAAVGPAATVAAAPPSLERTADWVFAEASARWGTTPPWLESQVLEMTRRFADLERDLQLRPRAGLIAEVFPELSWVAGAAPGAAAAAGPDHLGDLSVLLRVAQLMEDVWLACGLDRWWSHPLNLGWINLFGRWATAPTFRQWWPLLTPMFSPQFARFLEQRFPVPPVAPPDAGRPGAARVRSSRLLPLDHSAPPGLAQAWWQQRATQPRHWDGRAVIQHLYTLRRPDGSSVEVQVGLLAAAVGTRCVAWTSDDFFVPPSLWGAGLGGTFLEQLLDEFGQAFDRCVVVVKAPPGHERHAVAFEDRRTFIERYRKVGFRQHVVDEAQCRALLAEVPAGQVEVNLSLDTLLVLDLSQWRARRATEVV